MGSVVFTSANFAYLPKVLTLAESVKTQNPEFTFCFVINESEQAVAELLKTKNPLANVDMILSPGSLGIGPIDQFPLWLYSHSVVELCTAVKPFAFQHLSKTFDRVAYLDPDTWALSTLEPIFNFPDNKSFKLTPHMTAPAVNTQEIYDHELSVLRHGTYNLGFASLKSCEESRQVIDWWAERLYYFCYEEFELGVFTDQRWMDLAPALFDCVHIDRNPSLNVASWNVSRRQVSFETTARAWTVDGQPLTFFHFSGYNGGTHDRIVDRYQALNSDLKRLSELYRSSCESWRNKYPELSQSAWTLELHRDGTKITPSQRRAAVQQLRSSKASKTIDPFGVPLAHDGMDESLFGKGPSELLAIASAAKRELSGIYRSKSWKLTAPLRKVMRSLKN